MLNGKKQESENDDELLSLDMTFDEALELLVNTPPPTETDEDETHREERNQDDCD